MKTIADTFLNLLSIVLDFAATWLFCCVIAVVILPIVLDRIIFYIPKLIVLYRNKEVYFKGVVITFLEVIFWVTISASIYIYLYIFQNHLFVLATTESPAIFAWFISIIYIIRRMTNFDRTIKRNFYYEIYMRYIKPEALSEYMNFIEDLDSLELNEIKELAAKPIKYMYKQAALRKLKEASMI